jgi:hypothetical protein
MSMSTNNFMLIGLIIVAVTCIYLLYLNITRVNDTDDLRNNIKTLIQQNKKRDEILNFVIENIEDLRNNLQPKTNNHLVSSSQTNNTDNSTALNLTSSNVNLLDDYNVNNTYDNSDYFIELDELQLNNTSEYYNDDINDVEGLEDEEVVNNVDVLKDEDAVNDVECLEDKDTVDNVKVVDNVDGLEVVEDTVNTMDVMNNVENVAVVDNVESKEVVEDLNKSLANEKDNVNDMEVLSPTDASLEDKLQSIISTVNVIPDITEDSIKSLPANTELLKKTYSAEKLKRIAKLMNIKSHGSKKDIASRISKHLSEKS